MSRPRPVLVGIAGGTASGKTSLARLLSRRVGEEAALLLELDSYYRDLSHLPLEERHKVDFDHPDAFDWDLLLEHLDRLDQGQPAAVPVYDYKTHNRADRAVEVRPRPVILLEGILVFWNPDVRRRMDIKVFVDTPPDIRLSRRIRRDTMDRGRTLASVLEQYDAFVRPAHMEFCEPTKAHADIIIPRGAQNHVASAMLISRLEALVSSFGSGAGNQTEARLDADAAAP